MYAKPMMKMRDKARSMVRPLMAALLTVTVAGCETLNNMPSQGETVYAPQLATFSPSYAPEKITKVAVFPLFASGTANDVVGEGLISSINMAIESRHPHWSIVSYREVMRLIAEHGLTAGYRNLEADHNTYGALFGITSPATRDFIGQLQAVSGIDAVLHGSYLFEVRSEPVRLPNGEVRHERREVNSVTLSLFHVPTQSTWWRATSTRHGPREPVARAIGQTLASHIGKGTMQQM